MLNYLKRIAYTLIAIPVSVLGIASAVWAGSFFATAVMVACATPKQLSEMDDAAFARYVQRSADEAKLIADAAEKEGDLKHADRVALGNGLIGLSNGSVAGTVGSVFETLEADGYALAALAILMGRLGDRLESSGAWDEGGVLNPRAAEVLRAVGNALAQG